MEIIKYIFYLGIVFIIFSMIWGFFVFLYRMLSGFQPQGKGEALFLRIINLYLVVTLSGMETQVFLSKPGAPRLFITLIGIGILYSYLASRMAQQRFALRMNNLQINNTPINIRQESLILLLAMVYFSFTITHPEITYNPVTNWFFVAIDDIYKTPVIGWIIGFIGIFFLLVNILRGIYGSAYLINLILETIAGKGNNNNKKKDDDDGFTSYEVVEDDKID